jgi:hypothetical protein
VYFSRPGRESDRSPPSSAEVKNAWSYTSTPFVRLHGVALKRIVFLAASDRMFSGTGM